MQYQGDSEGERPNGASDEQGRPAIRGMACVVERPAEERPETRELVDADGVRWRVYELVSPSGTGRRVARCLVFDSDAVVRRVSSFPEEWRELPPADLMALSWNR